MAIERIRTSLIKASKGHFNIYERRPGDFQLILPILHEDGDMVEIYLRASPKGEGHIRICDYGLTLMRLSYTFEVNTPSRQRIFDSILFNNGVDNHCGNLSIDTPIDRLYEGILQFAGCVQKVCNMRYWTKETVRSAFYDDLNEYVTNKLTEFNPKQDQLPLADSPLLTVDWDLAHNRRSFYLFGVRGSDKAKNVAISLLEFRIARLSFISLVIHENMQDLGSRESSYLTRNADKQYPDLDAFRQEASKDIPRLSGAALW